MESNHQPTDYKSVALPLSYNGIMVGEDGVEPTEPEGMRFTVSPATVYGILSHVASPQGFEPWLPIRKNGLAIRRIKPLCHDDMAQSVGFEPTDTFVPTVFKTASINQTRTTLHNESPRISPWGRERR